MGLPSAMSGASLRSVLRPAVHRAIRGYFWFRRRMRPLPGGRLLRSLVRGEVPPPPMALALRWRLGPGVGRCAQGQQVVMLVVSDLRIDPRVERETRALAAAGYSVTVICPDLGQGELHAASLDWGPGVTFDIQHWTAGSFINQRPGYVAEDLYISAARYRPFAFHAHDLNTACAALAAARLRGAHLVVDFHEWTSENVHWNATNERYEPYADNWKRELREMEARCMREASAVVTVCDSIADAIASELGEGRRPTVVRNIPTLAQAPSREYLPLKQQLGLPDERFLLLWQGGTGPTRLIEPIIEALAFSPRCTFVIRGPSLDMFGDSYRAIAARAGAADRLILLPPVRSSDVVAASRGADAGIWTLPNLCRNFTFALPNKIFEYMASGLPVLVADYPEARRVVDTHAVGLTFDPYDPRSIADAINRLIDEPARARQMADQTVIALAVLDAGREWQKLVACYRGLGEEEAAA